MSPDGTDPRPDFEEPTPASLQVGESPTCTQPYVELVRGDALSIEPIDWLWRYWLAAGKLHILAGSPGTGKTTLAISLAAIVSRGGTLPDGTLAEAGSVVIWSGEDDPADTLGPRLIAAGADMSRVYLVKGVMNGSGERRTFDPAKDAGALVERLAEIPDVRLLIVDPVVSAVAGDSHKNAEVRRGLQPLVDLAQHHRCALLGISHFTKGTKGSDPLDRVTGSLAFGALARVVLGTAKADEKDEGATRRVLARAKSNIGPDDGGYAYDVRQAELPEYPGVIASYIDWGQALEGTARELLTHAEQDEPGHGQSPKDFLRELLAAGPCASNDIYRDGEAAGFSRDAMKRAKRNLRVRAHKQGMAGGWIWKLPDKTCGEGSEGSAQNMPHPSHPSKDETVFSWIGCEECCPRCDGEGCEWCDAARYAADDPEPAGAK